MTPTRLIALTTVVLAVLPVGLGKYPLFVLTLALVYSISTLGLNLVAGYGGQHSFGHGAFMLVGAYAVALGPAKWGLAFPWAMVLGVIAAALFGVLIGLPSIRLVGFSLAIVSFAFGITAHSLIKATDYTGGPTGLFVPALDVLGVNFRKPLPIYYLTAVLFVLGLAVAQSLGTSKTGRALRSIAQSELVSRALGIDPVRYKLFVFVMSAVYGAVAGGLLAAASGYVAPETFGADLSIFMFAAIVIGGMATQGGPIVGAFFISVIPEVTQASRDTSEIVFAVIFAVVATVAPQGVWGLITSGWNRVSGRRARPAVAAGA